MSQGPTYVIPIEAVASPAAQFDAFEYVAPATKSARIRRCCLGQNSDYGDAQAEGLMARIITGHTVTGSGGAAAGFNKLQNGYAAAGGTGATMNTTVASAGAPVTKHSEGFNVQIGWDYRPTPEEFIMIAPSERVVIRISAPADPLTIAGILVVEELG